MTDKDLVGICNSLRNCAPTLETLHLEGLEHGNAGFQSLAKLLKEKESIKHLHCKL